jgi:hypothetical protein
VLPPEPLPVALLNLSDSLLSFDALGVFWFALPVCSLANRSFTFRFCEAEGKATTFDLFVLEFDRLLR